MEKRRHSRIERRLACNLATASIRAPGVICDVSETGLFVETPANPSLNSIVRLLVFETEDQAEFSLEAGVARTCPAASQLESTLLQSGIGLVVIAPRNAFDRWVVRPARPAMPTTNSTLAPLGSQPQGGMGKYRVRLIRQDRSGTQIVTLRCESEAAARAKALSRLGGAWRIAESQPV